VIIEVAHDVVALEPLIEMACDTSRIEIADRSIVVETVRSSRNGGIILLHGITVTQGFLSPVGIACIGPLVGGVVGVNENIGFAGIGIVGTDGRFVIFIKLIIGRSIYPNVGLVHVRHPLHDVHGLELHYGLVDGIIHGERNLRTGVFFPAFGGDQDDPEGRAGTVNCSRRCVFENGDTFDVVGVNLVDVHGDIVYQNQGTPSVDRSISTYVKGRTAPQGTAGLGNIEIGDGALQGLPEIAHR